MTSERLSLALYLLVIIGSSGVDGRISIPDELQECYRTDGYGDASPPLPANLRVLLDILRKAERHSAAVMDVRMFSTSLLHRLKFDGVEYSRSASAKGPDVIPYAATGSQRARQRLNEVLMPGDARLFPAEALSRYERCALHRFVSNAIDVGSPPAALPVSRWRIGREPIEYGVVETEHGTVAVGAVIGAVAAAFQRQVVTLRAVLERFRATFGEQARSFGDSYDDEPFSFSADNLSAIDNLWFTTLAGDLAEVVLYQGLFNETSMTLGANGFWSSKIFPTYYYLSESREIQSGRSYDATSAEIMGDIDGLVLASKVVDWLEDFRGLRLSQLLDGYYSENGLYAFNSSNTGMTPTRACDRWINFQRTVSKTILQEQTLAATRLMIARNGAPGHITDKALQRTSSRAVQAYYVYLEDELRRASTVNCPRTENRPTVEALLVFEPRTDSVENVELLIGSLIDRLDVSMYGSRFGMINGISGEWLLNVTHSPSVVYHVLSSMKSRLSSEHSSTNYTAALERISDYLDDVWEQLGQKRVMGSLGQAIVLYLTPGDITTDDRSSAIELLKRIKRHHPDVYFFYCATKSDHSYFQPFILTEEDRLIGNCDVNNIAFHLLAVAELMKHVDQLAHLFQQTCPAVSVPKSLRPTTTQHSRELNDASLPKHEFEDYISPSSVNTYRIHPQWRRSTRNLRVTVHGFGYGILEVCRQDGLQQASLSNKADEENCKILRVHETISFTDDIDCTLNRQCTDFYLQVRVISSLRKCTEIDCKFPDHVRYIVRSQTSLQPNATSKLLESYATLIVSILLIMVLW